MAKLTKSEMEKLFNEPNPQETREKFRTEMSKVANTLLEPDDTADEDEFVISTDEDKAEVLEIKAENTVPDKTDEPKKADESKPKADTKTEEKEQELDPVTAKLELFERQLNLTKLANDKLKLEAEKWQTLANRRAGELDYIKKTKVDSDHRQPDSLAELIDEEDKPTKTAVVEDERIVQLIEDASFAARRAALQDFSNEHEDVDKYLDGIQKYVNEHRREYAPELDSGNPKTIRKASKLLLREAYIAAKEETYAREYSEAETKYQQRLAEINEKKKGSISPSSAAAADSTGRPKAAKSVKDLSDEELRAIINRRGR